MLAIGVDIGGTFTDIVGALEDGHLVFTKVSSTPGNLVDGVRRGVEKLLQQVRGSTGRVTRFIHGTTVATNAILERKGALIGLLATEGFEDVLEMGRQRRSRMYDLDMDPETPAFLAPRRRRMGIRERLDRDGTVLCALDERQVIETVRALKAQYTIQAVAVCYLFSFKNPVHEHRTRELIREHFPELPVSLSCEVDPTYREYERTCLTAFDAYLRPVVERYIRQLEGALAGMGVGAGLHVMQSRGGVTSARLATDRPVTMVLSGPAAGVLGGAFAAERSGIGQVITLDMGGTSCDVALVQDGRPLFSSEGRIDLYPLRLPMIDVSTLGAGGGSLAWLDAGGGLHVGPQSAGAEPGPACYGRGGTEPTVTDASLVLGYLNPDGFAGGEMTLQADAAVRALERIAKPLGMTPLEAAYGIHRVVNARMADQIRLVSVRKGHDPRHFALVLMGGAGPVHGGVLAADLAIPTVIVPETPGVLSALGLLVANIEHERATTLGMRAKDTTLQDLIRAFEPLEQECWRRMQADRVAPEQVTVLRSAEARYLGQSYELEVPIVGVLDQQVVGRIEAAFHARHEQVYGHSSPGAEVEIVNLRAVLASPLPKPVLRQDLAVGGTHAAQIGVRRAYFGRERGLSEAPIYARERLPMGDELIGPAIVEQADTTIVIYPGQRARLDQAGNLLMTPG
jgi:N-methylhydantoinase A